MSENQAHDYVTKIQVLSLLPDRTNEGWPGYMALQSGLSSMRSHPDCTGVYYLQQFEDPQDIVIISKWPKYSDIAVATSNLLGCMMPHLKSPPRSSIQVNRPLYSFIRYTISDFITIYFPIRVCTEQFQKALEERIEAFSGLALPSYGNPEDLMRMGSGWVEEVQRINGNDRKVFILSMSWHNGEAEKSFKDQNIQWAKLMQYLSSMGGTQQEEYHGEVLRVPRNRRIYEDPDSSESKEKSSLPKAVQSLHDLQIASQSESRPAMEEGQHNKSSCEPIYAADLLRTRSNLKRTNYAISGKSPSIRVGRVILSSQDELDLELESSNDEWSEDSPILTPSSSCMSLSSLFYNNTFIVAGQSPKLRSDEESPKATLDADRKVQVGNFAASLFDKIGESDKSSKQLNSDYDYDRDLSSTSCLEPCTETEPLPTTDPISKSPSPSPWERANTLPSNQTSKGTALLDCGQCIANTMLRNTGARWDPDEEVENAKSRFNKYRKTPPSTHLQGQRVKPTPPPPPMRGSHIQTVKKDPTPWKTFFADLLSNPSKASNADASPATVYGAKYIHGQNVSEYQVEELNEKFYRVPGSFTTSSVAEGDV